MAGRTGERAMAQIVADWIPHKTRWLGDRQIKPVPEIENKPKVAEIEEKNYPAVIFIKPKCPKCGNKKSKWNGTDGHIRYYKCSCGCKFKAIEK